MGVILFLDLLLPDLLGPLMEQLQLVVVMVVLVLGQQELLVDLEEVVLGQLL
jgi:hypothetical protein